MAQMFCIRNIVITFIAPYWMMKKFSNVDLVDYSISATAAVVDQLENFLSYSNTPARCH